MAKSIDEMCTEIRNFHQTGSVNLENRTDRGGYGDNALKTEAEAINLNPEILSKARIFADPEKGYTSDELDELVQLIRTNGHRFQKGKRSFGYTYVISLLPLSKDQRRQIQKELFEKGWSLKDLQTAIKARFPRGSTDARRKRGRRHHISDGLAERMAQIHSMCESCLRLFAEMRRPRDPETEPIPASLPEDLLKALNKAKTALEKVQTFTEACSA